jgi:hypothetical protein
MIWELPFINYSTVLKSDIRRLRLIFRETGPFINLDFVSCFLRIIIAELSLKDRVDMSTLRVV